MKCKNCNRETEPGSALHCEMCVSDFCPDCAREIAFCDCYGELKYYS